LLEEENMCLELATVRQGLLSGEGREAGEVGRWLENPPGKNAWSLLSQLATQVADD